MEDHPKLKAIVGRREKIEFAQTVTRYDRNTLGLKSAKRDLVVTPSAVFIIGRKMMEKGPDKGQLMEVVKRRIPLSDLSQVSLSILQDDLVVLHGQGSYDSLLQVPFKTELVTTLKRLKEAGNSGLRIHFHDT